MVWSKAFMIDSIHFCFKNWFYQTIFFICEILFNHSRFKIFLSLIDCTSVVALYFKLLRENKKISN